MLQNRIANHNLVLLFVFPFPVIKPDDIFGARVLGVAPAHQVLHLVDVEGCYNLGEGKILGNRPRNTNLAIDNKLQKRKQHKKGHLGFCIP